MPGNSRSSKHTAIRLPLDVLEVLEIERRITGTPIGTQIIESLRRDLVLPEKPAPEQKDKAT